jgi:hypothetical protein
MPDTTYCIKPLTFPDIATPIFLVALAGAAEVAGAALLCTAALLAGALDVWGAAAAQPNSANVSAMINTKLHTNLRFFLIFLTSVFYFL